MIDKVIKVNLGSEGVVPIIKITIGDDMWRFHFQVYHESKRWIIPNDVTVTLSGKKPDGGSYDIGCTISNNEILADCNKTITDVPGMSYALLKIYDGEEKLVNSCRISIFCASDTPCSSYGQSYYIPSSTHGGSSTSGGYVKPATGIPKGDLTREVQNALEPEIYMAVYGSTTEGELDEAYEAGKLIFVNNPTDLITYSLCSVYSYGNEKRGYKFISWDGKTQYTCQYGENGWENDSFDVSEDNFGYTVVYENAIGEDDTIDFDGGGSGVEIPTGGSVGDILIRTSTGARWEAPAGDFTGDNTRPITAAAVNALIGDINTLLSSI